MQERRAAEVAKRNREYEGRAERIEAAKRYQRDVPLEQRKRAAIEQLATNIARERGGGREEARRAVVDAVLRGERQRAERR